VSQDLSVGRPSHEPDICYRYDLFGLTFESAEQIPGIPASKGLGSGKVVQIEFGTVPQRIENPQFVDEFVQANGSEYLFISPDQLRLYAVGDQRIIVERLDGWDFVRSWTVALSIGLSIAGLRRGYIPLHASAILTAKGCFAFAGQSGAGKSTIAASLIKRGYDLFAEDLSLVHWNDASEPIIGQGIQELRLWRDSVEALGWTDTEPFAVPSGTSKSVFRRDQMQQNTAQLRRIYSLEFSRDDADPGIYRLEGVEAMQMLVGLLRFRLGLLPVGNAALTFERLAVICDEVQMFRFVRPRDYSRSAFWLDRLIEHFEA
jgi:hypothetical protein